MIRHPSSLAIALFLIAFIYLLAIVAARPASAPLHNQSLHSSLQVISGSQLYTNVTGDNLQPAAPPAGSATSSELSPQQARPSICLPGETPSIDGCLSP